MLRNYIRILIAIFILGGYCSCKWEKNDSNIKFYEDFFLKNNRTFDSLSNYLLAKYAKDEKNKHRVRLILINPYKQKRTLNIEQIDSNLLGWLNKVNIESLNLEREDSTCLRGYYFDKMYFTYYKRLYRRVVYYIYSTCIQDSLNKETKKIERRSINKHWDILIDNS